MKYSLNEQAQNALRQPFFDWLEEKGYPKFDIKEVGKDTVKFSVFSGDKESDLPEEYEPNFLLEIGAGKMAVSNKPIKDDFKPSGALHRDW